MAVVHERHKTAATAVVARGRRKAMSMAARKARGRRWRWHGGGARRAGGGTVAVQGAGVVARMGAVATARMGRSGGDGGVACGQLKAESRRMGAVTRRQERYMTGGPRGFSYRWLIRRLGFKRRLIASV
jgi:hypothetical protein